jgi:aspartate aminotransferase
MTSTDTVSPSQALNANVQKLKLSATLEINERCQQLINEGQKIYRLGFGQSPFPVPEPVVEELRKQAHQKAYLPVQGLPALRQSVADYLQRTESLNFSQQQILIGPGTKELMFLLQSVYQAEVIIPSPSWVSYEPQALLLGRAVRWLPGSLVDNPGLVAKELEQLCSGGPRRPRLLILNYPMNPSGSSYSTEQLQEIAEVARRHKVLILSDEIYSGFNFEGDHLSIARFYPEGTIISNGLSKWCGAGGWRLGFFAMPSELEWLQRPMLVLATEIYSAVNSPTQYAAIKAFNGGEEIDHYLTSARRLLKSLMIHSYHQLKEAGAELSSPQGGFYLFPVLDKLRSQLNVEDSVSLCHKLLEETGIAALPGSAFGRPPFELSMRLACVDFNGAEALAAITKSTSIGEHFLQQYCRPTVEAIDKLCDWLKEK